jgi:hypothetical protein
MTNEQKSRYNQLMYVAKNGDYMSEAEFDELLGLFKQLNK